LLATATDFMVMVACVELARFRPAVATAVGAFAGGGVNYLVGRRWTYRSDGKAHHEVARYVAVSFGGLACNALGVHLGGRVIHSHYVVLRGVVAVLVSVLWNFPLQRWFVFR
jgi:putative flippase GtrA